jgi:hypothetical protein
MPQRFEVHDINGRLVARGEVPAGSPAAVWQCSEADSGTYVLSVIDGDGNHLASVPVIKQ